MADMAVYSLNLANAFRNYFAALLADAHQAEALKAHMQETPSRVSAMYMREFWGLKKDPASALDTVFDNHKDYNQMVIVSRIEFTSWCAHHLLPFFGMYTFAYIPSKRIVGLSKIPRMVDILCARPQIQEILTEDAVDVFQNAVSPKGCAVAIDAIHTCMCARGVKRIATTRTTAFRGCFFEVAPRQEFLSAVGQVPELR